MQALRTSITSSQLAFLAHVCTELSWSQGSLLEDPEAQALLHAAVCPLAATVRAHCARCGAACTLAGAECQGAIEGARVSAARALLACLRSPSAPFEAVQLLLAAMALAWGCARGGGAVAAALCDALAPSAGGDSAGGEESGGGSVGGSSNALPAAFSSGIVGLLNALSGGAEGEGGGTLLSDGLPPLPVPPPALLACAVGFLAEVLQRAGGVCGGAAAAAAEAAGLPSPLVARAAAGVRPLYASDARVAIDLALRGAENAEEAAERACWARALRALAAHADGRYRRGEIDVVATAADDDAL
jgi:hypothetical protein